MLTIRQEGPREPSRRKAGRKSYDNALTTTGGSAAHSDQLQPRHQGPGSKNLNMRIQGCQMQPASTYDKAKWRAYQVHVYKKGVP